MGGRSLLREPSTSFLCAFCAHRLGASRYAQRRFLQSSQASFKPPAEATARRDDNGDRSDAQHSQPAWGQSGGTNGLGSASSWAQPAFGSAPVPSPAPGLNGGQSSATSSEIPKSQAPSHNVQSISQPGAEDLLPHERLARENMLKSENKAQQREVRIHSGPGPENTRGFRPIPNTAAERLNWAEQSLSRRKARERHSANMDRSSNRTPKWNTVSADVSSSRPSGPDEELPKWSMLKRRGEDDKSRAEGISQEPRVSQEDRFTAIRAQREEQARSGIYVPLSRRAELQIASDSTTGPSQEIRGDVSASEQRGRSRGGEHNRAVFDQEPARFTVRRTGFRKVVESGQNDRAEAQTRSKPEYDFTVRRSISDHLRDNRADANLTGPSLNQRNSQNEQYDRRTRVAQASDRESTVKFKPIAPSEQVTRDPMGEISVKMKAEEAIETQEDNRRKPGRFTEKAAPAYEAAHKGRGKDKDKVRRRQQFIEEEEDDAAEREAVKERAELKRQRKAEKAALKAAAPTPILLPEYISVSNLAVALKIRFENFVQKLEELGFEETGHDYVLNAENAGLIAMEYNFEAIIDKGESEDLKAREPASDPSILPQRPPVVTIMGHVDHGKTTLLDWLRKSSVAATEHGGITQHIGAFSVPMPSGKIITFLDTPGHAAFLSMRQRGANVTDIVILVVAADDSVKPQTIEAIKHAQAAKVPIIVAINKIDKDESNIDRVKQDLARHGLDVEDFGGETQVVCVSGKTGQGMDELEEAAVTLSEILDMRAEVDGPAEGWVLEASIKSMGKVATVLVRRGTMRPGDFIVAGKTWARIRCLRNEAGVEIEEAGPGTPVEIDGWREQPSAGDEVLQAHDESKAKRVVDFRLEKEERDKMAQDMEAINENRKTEQERREREKADAEYAAEDLQNNEVAVEKSREAVSGAKEIYFIVKGDVSGSVEAVVDSISAIGNKEVRPHILRSGVGQLSEFDVEHAAAANGVLINFNTVVEPNIAQLAAHSKVSILAHNIIYRLVDDVKAELSKHLSPLITSKVLGEAEIAEIFQITIKGRKQKPIAGSKVRNGTISKNAKVRVLRRGKKIFDGTLSSLKNFKKDVMEIKKGAECGIGFDDWFDFEVGDHIQSYEEISEKRYL